MAIKRMVVVVVASALYWAAPMCLADGRIQKMDRVASSVQKLRTEAGNYENNSDLRENYSGVIDWGEIVLRTLQMMTANATRGATELNVDANKTFVREAAKQIQQTQTDAAKTLREMADNAEDEISKKDPFGQLQEDLENVLEAYQSFKEDVAERAKMLKSEMEDKSEEWDRERSDDEEYYLAATVRLKQFIESNMEAVEQGEELLEDLDDASDDWESASRSGDKDEIERAYRTYHEANEKMRNWKRAYSNLNRDYSDIFQKHHDAWVQFVQDTKESFRFYDGDVAEANAAYYEFMKVMYGET